MRWWAAAGLAVVLAGCGGASSEVAQGTVVAPPGAAPAWPWMNDHTAAIAGRMRQIASSMSAAGLHVGNVGGGGFLALRSGDTFPIDVPAGICMTITALASSGIHDLDTTLYVPSGDVLAEDVEPDSHPTVQVCATGHARHLYYHVQAYDGAGAYIYASFVGSRGKFPLAARVVGGRPGVAADAGAATAEQGRVHELTEGVARRGFQPMDTPRSVQLAANQHVRVPLTVQAAHCYTVAAFGAPGLSAIDIRVLDEEGHEPTRDVSGTSAPAAQLCVQADGEYAVDLHAVSGSGDARIAFFEGPEAAVGGVGGLWLGQRHETLASTEPLDQALAHSLAAARRAGWGGAAHRGGGHLAPAQAVDDAVVLAPGKCTLILAAGGRGIGELGLRVVDEQGHILADHSAQGPSASVRLCVDRLVHAHAEVVARRGSGAFAIESLTKVMPQSLPHDVAIPDRGALLDVLDGEKAAGRVLEGAISTVALPAQGDASVQAAPPAQGCAHVHVVADGLGGTIGAELERGHRIAARLGGRSVAFSVCQGDGPGAATLAVRRQGMTGKAFVLRFVLAAPPAASAARQ